MFKEAKDLLLLKAFRPGKSDVKIRLAERFCGQDSIMGVSMSKDSVTCAEIRFTGKSPSEVVVSKVKTFSTADTEKGEEAQRFDTITSFAQENGLSYALLLNSPEIQILKMVVSSDKVGLDRLYHVKQGIDGIFGDPLEEGRAYAYVSNVRTNETLVFSYNQEKVDETANFLVNAGLEVVRTTCSIYVLIDHLINDRSELSVRIEQNPILLIYSNDCLFVASIHEGRFEQMGFRASISIKDISAHLPRMIERFEYNHEQVLYLNCSNWDIEAYFEFNYPGLKMISMFSESFEGMFQVASYG